ncbi:hypothetical protein WAI453_007623 [Rhynchosporium graminicola]
MADIPVDRLPTVSNHMDGTAVFGNYAQPPRTIIARANTNHAPPAYNAFTTARKMAGTYIERAPSRDRRDRQSRSTKENKYTLIDHDLGTR